MLRMARRESLQSMTYHSNVILMEPWRLKNLAPRFERHLCAERFGEMTHVVFQPDSSVAWGSIRMTYESILSDASSSLMVLAGFLL
jgi:hypothetical protein